MHQYNTCTICKEVKSTDKFIKDKRISRGYRNQCKECEVKRVAQSKGQTYKQRGVYKGIHSKNLVDEQYCDMFDYFRKKFTEARQRIKKNGKPAPEEDIMLYWEKLKEQDFKCSLSGMDLVFSTGSPWQLSIDCIVPELGYTIDNVQFTTWAANRAKGDLNDDDFKKMIDAIYKKM